MASDNGFDVPDHGSNGSSNGEAKHQPGFTGRYLIAFEPGTMDQAASLLYDRAGVRTLSARDAGVADGGSENMVFEEIGAAVVSAEPDQQRALLAAVRDTSAPVSYMEPEQIMWASGLPAVSEETSGDSGFRGLAGDAGFEAPRPAPAAVTRPEGINADFLRGYAAAAQGLLAATGGYDEPLPAARTLELEAAALSTWGLITTRVTSSAFSGRGIRVAVLDTGMDLHHPDFSGRTVVPRSFIAGESVQDGHGHGTHCIGTSCGPRAPVGTQRYGVAYGAEIYAGKVLSNAGSGADGGILAGINWAVQNGCALVSMSLGAPVSPGESYSPVYQNAARLAEQRGTLIVAAAGNESRRPAFISPVGRPANCPTILAIGALGPSLQAASFSNGGLNGNGGEVNLAAPGVDVFSTWPMPRRYNTISGTSMATPHVAGILALYAEATGLRGLPLANYVLRRARRLAPVRDFGWGLVQAS
jgi:subtilisin family serine protease